jgi:hypothetical protein
VSRERARRREEREREAAAAVAVRAAEAQRRARREARAAVLTRWVPPDWRRQRGRTGIIAERQRRQAAMTVAVVVALNVLTFCFTDTWDVRALVLVATLLGAPVLYTLLFRK